MLLDTSPEETVGNSQKRAIQIYRSRLSERGLVRFEVLGRDADRDLIRSLASRLAEEGPEASRLPQPSSHALPRSAPTTAQLSWRLSTSWLERPSLSS
ncbi:hypothetical protein DU475_15790 [Rhodopseudomonas sp. WA056]|nr:hypothetical protein [Rhodopseudomonas sp. WA056]